MEHQQVQSHEPICAMQCQKPLVWECCRAPHLFTWINLLHPFKGLGLIRTAACLRYLKAYAEVTTLTESAVRSCNTLVALAVCLSMDWLVRCAHPQLFV